MILQFPNNLFKDYMNTFKPVLKGHLWDKEKLKKGR